MLSPTNNTVVLRVQLEEGKTEAQLKQLVLDIEKTRAAQLALTAARKAGTKTDEEYAAETVQLRQQLKAQQQEQTALTKNLDLYRTATGELANTYTGQQAQLSLAQRQYQQLAGSQTNSTESTKALASTIAELRGELTETDKVQGLFIREVGKYPRGENLASLIQQMVKLQEETKNLVAGTDQAAAAQVRIVGFMTQAAQAGAKEGKTFEETTSFIKEYSAAIRPATADLVKLEKEQLEVAAATKEAGDEIVQIGFKLAAARKQISAATDEFKEAAPAAKETGNSLSESLSKASEAAELLGVDLGGLESGLGRAKKGLDIAKGAFGSLRGAILAVPIFALLAAFTALVAYFTKTREGSNQLETAMNKVGAIFDVIIDRAGVLGKAIAQLFSGDFTAALETARKSYQGIGDEMQREINLAGELSKARQQLERDEINNIDTNKKLLNQVERLKNVRDNEFNSIKQRQAANEKAYAVELTRERTLTDLAQRRINLLQAEADRRGGLDKLNNDQLREFKEATNVLVDIQEDAAGKQNELITNRYQLEQERLDKLIERRAQAFALEANQLTQQLAKVQVNSDQELAIRQQQLRNEQQASLNVKKLTVAQLKAIDVKYETDSLALTLDFQRRRLQAAIQAQADLTAAQLAGQQQGSQEAFQLQAQQIEDQRRASLAALATNTDNEAARAKINAQAAQQQRQLEYQQAVKNLQDYLANKTRLVENDYAAGLIQEGEYQRRLAAIAKAGTDAQTVINKDYNQDNAENQRQADELDTAARRQHTADVKKEEEVRQQLSEARVQAAQQATDAVISLFGEESAAGQAAMVIRKTLAIAEIAINLQKQLSLNHTAAAELAVIPIVGPGLAVAYEVTQDALAIAAAAAGTAAVLKLQRGGIADGPSHDEGGIPLYRRGRHTGIEIEGGEPVLTKGVSQNPLLLSIASLVNQAAGGRPLVPSGVHLALGAITTPVAREQLLRGDVAVDPRAVGAAVADALRKNPAVNRWVDWQDAKDRNAFTDRIRKD